MYKRGLNERKTAVAPETQVVVKLKQTREARGVLHALALEGRMPRGRALAGLAAAERRYAMEPIFPVAAAALPGARRARSPHAGRRSDS